ncbi:MAG: DoxX family protein [Deltaproteobacteria bacterium]|nr:DoxX family protein [Deltaproteobacteria bacterium]
MEILFATDPSYAILIVRVVLGVIFFAHGAQKVLGWFGGYGLKGTTGHFTSMGMPLALAYLVCFVEFLSGIGLIVGFLARLCGLGVAAVMLGAMVTVHWQHGFFLNAELKPGKGHGIEFTLALLAMGLAILIAGAGALSIDRVIAGQY